MDSRSCNVPEDGVLNLIFLYSTEKCATLLPSETTEKLDLCPIHMHMTEMLIICLSDW